MVVLIVLLVIIASVVLYAVSTYNRLVGLRNRVNDQWSQIDVELKRRFDLIPNLVETVKGYAKHEKETLENLQAQLKDTEDKISFARKFYNDTALKLNNAVEMFPSNLIANMFKFTKVEYFKADEEEKENVKVEF